MTNLEPLPRIIKTTNVIMLVGIVIYSVSLFSLYHFLDWSSLGIYYASEFIRAMVLLVLIFFLNKNYCVIYSYFMNKSNYSGQAWMVDDPYRRLFKTIPAFLFLLVVEIGMFLSYYFSKTSLSLSDAKSLGIMYISVYAWAAVLFTTLMIKRSIKALPETKVS